MSKNSLAPFSTLEKIDPEEKIKRSKVRKQNSNNSSHYDRVTPNNSKSTKPNAPILPLTELKKQTPEKAILETLPEGPTLDASGLKNQQPRMGVSDRSTNPRYIPSNLKQEVYMRDKGICTHPNCNSRKFLEYDHMKPVAMGGKTTTQNLRLLCRTHNQRAAIDKFGYQKMQTYFNSQSL